MQGTDHGNTMIIILNIFATHKAIDKFKIDKLITRDNLILSNNFEMKNNLTNNFKYAYIHNTTQRNAIGKKKDRLSGKTIRSDFALKPVQA